MSNQLGGLGPTAQDLVIPFCLGEGEPPPYFFIIPLEIISELLLLKYQTGQINKFKGKYIMELSKLKHLQRYMNYFEIDFKRFECHPQSDQLSDIFNPSMEDSFDTLQTADIVMNPSH